MFVLLPMMMRSQSQCISVFHTFMQVLLAPQHTLNVQILNKLGKESRLIASKYRQTISKRWATRMHLIKLVVN